jgi:hypothetical protein
MVQNASTASAHREAGTLNLTNAMSSGTQFYRAVWQP